ncbi:MAG: tripartite tricarboxylate transporter substrate binding protein [Sulfitobacter sp. SK025]|nr:MAG: tripartite tricarboxylate transporter substrate binding protein [Sulfitobacter sp. SK025]
MIKSTRTTILNKTIAAMKKLCLVCALIGSSVNAMADEYPNRPLTIIAAFSAGSGTDTAARLLAEGLSKQLKQPVVVENRPGANTMIGTTYASKANPDGYTLAMIFVDNMLINPAIMKNIKYSSSDLDPVAIVGQIPLVVLAAPDLPYDSLQQLRDASMKEGKSFNFGTWGHGSVAHVFGAMLANEGGFNFNYIPFPGSAPSINAVMGGHVDLAVATPASSASLIARGKAKALGVSFPTRIPRVTQRAYPHRGRPWKSKCDAMAWSRSASRR